jgi:phenylalanyl-tRNA synthetase beta chain
MRFSKKWLDECLTVNLSTEKVCEQLTGLGLEVEKVFEPAKFFNVVVARIEAAVQHPEADRLRVCNVFDGTERFQVVCGAANARAGINVALAKIGAVLPGNFTIKKAKLRNVESQGMLCSEKELSLAEVSEGIMELPEDAPLGTDFSVYWDMDSLIAIELKVTPDRGDCLSIKGLARDLSAKNECALKMPDSRGTIFCAQHQRVQNIEPLRMTINVNVPEACPRYCGRIIQLGKVTETPAWIVARLNHSGVRSIHPVVDITNYVMLEMGQPMHAFDFDKLDSEIVVRYANAKEKIALLDDSEATLLENTLVIADKRHALAIAGIMGGKPSSVTEHTKTIFLESAFFTPKTIMGKARLYGKHTDSSARFERGVDASITREAIERATQLILEICGGEAGEIIEVKNEAFMSKSHRIILRHQRLNDILGFSIDAKKIESILKHLGLNVTTEKDGWAVETPLHRYDLTIEADLIHEVARVYGYEHIPSIPGTMKANMLPSTEEVLSLRNVRSLLVERGYHETMSYSFNDGAWGEGRLELTNPISVNHKFMRKTLWEGLLAGLVNNQAHKNQAHKQERVRLFEVGRVYLGQGKDEQPIKIAGLLSGSRYPEQWGEKSQPIDFYDIKADIEALICLTGYSDKVQFRPSKLSTLHPVRSTDIYLKGQLLGHVGALHPKLGDAYVFELDWALLRASKVKQYQSVSKFPAIRRDIALLVNNTILFSQVYDIVQKSSGDFLSKLILFDVYRGNGVPEDKKSLALGLTLQKDQGTFVDSEVVALMNKITKALKDQLDADLRE